MSQRFSRINEFGYAYDRGDADCGCDPCRDPVLPAPYPTVHYPPTNPCPPQRMPQRVDRDDRDDCFTPPRGPRPERRAGHTPWTTLFDERSMATASNVVMAQGHGLLFQAFGLQGADNIRLQMVSGTPQHEVVQDVLIGGLQAQLTAENNILFVPFPGRFRLQYTGAHLGDFYACSTPVPYEYYPAMAAFTQAVATSVNVFDTSPHPSTEPFSQSGQALPTRMTGSARKLVLGDPDGWFSIGGKRVPFWN